jgi:hypothetical protein
MGRTTSTPSRVGALADPGSVVRLGSGRQVDWNAVGEAYRQGMYTVKLNGAAAADDVTITVDALPADLALDTRLYFGQSKEFALVTETALKGATTVKVQALPSALEDNDEAKYAGPEGAGKKHIPALTVMAENQTSKKMIPLAQVAAMATWAGVATAFAGNTGNGAMGAITATTGAKPGNYSLVIIEPAANAGTFQVEDPDGVFVGRGTVGVAFSAGGLAFTLADGATDFVAGDGFTIAVTQTDLFKVLGMIASDANEGAPEEAKTGYGVWRGAVLYDGLLPEATGSPKRLPAATKALLAAAGCVFHYQDYSNSVQ